MQPALGNSETQMPATSVQNSTAWYIKSALLLGLCRQAFHLPPHWWHQSHKKLKQKNRFLCPNPKNTKQQISVPIPQKLWFRKFEIGPMNLLLFHAMLNKIILVVAFGNWPLSLSMMFSRFTPAITCVIPFYRPPGNCWISTFARIPGWCLHMYN